MRTDLTRDDVNHIIQALGHEIVSMRYDKHDGSDNFETLLGLYSWLCHSEGGVSLEDNLPF